MTCLARIIAARVVTVCIGCSALLWGSLNILEGATSDFFRDVEGRLLRFETFSQAASNRMLAGAAVQGISYCDDHAQRALLLLEIPLADAALRTGARDEYDQHMQSLQSRTAHVLACSPRDSFAWLVAFGLRIEHGLLDKTCFGYLALSYETSPNEAWVAVRRTLIAIPVMLSAPEPLQRKILDEFQNLVAHGFVELAARAYLNAPRSVQIKLDARIGKLERPAQNAFLDELRKLQP